MPHQKEANIYIIDSSFQFVSAALIARIKKNNIFICFNQNLYQTVKSENKNWSVHYVRFKKEKGFFGRQIGIRLYLEKIFAIVKTISCKKVSFFMPETAGSDYNYLINEANNIYGKKNTSINIIPDGLSNIALDLFSSRYKKLKTLAKPLSIKDRFFGLKYSSFSTDRKGIIANYIDTIYTIPNMPNEYPADKTKVLNIPKTKHKKTNNKKALILGQHMVYSHLMRAEDERKIVNTIQHLLKNEEISNVFYIPHFFSKLNNTPYELLPENATIINPTKPVELYLLDNHFDFVIGTATTALITSKLLLGKDCNCISVGAEKSIAPIKGALPKIINTYKKLDIKVISA